MLSVRFPTDLNLVLPFVSRQTGIVEQSSDQNVTLKESVLWGHRPRRKKKEGDT